MIEIDMKLPSCCDECFAIDAHGDYPYCLISRDQQGYTFNTRENRMPSCPLKDNEPRVLTLDELRALYDTVHFVWVEDNGDDNCFNGYAEVDVYKEKVELFEFGNEVQWEPDNDNYGKTWRCWSARPTDEQREAVPWQD